MKKNVPSPLQAAAAASALGSSGDLAAAAAADDKAAAQPLPLALLAIAAGGVLLQA